MQLTRYRRANQGAKGRLKQQGGSILELAVLTPLAVTTLFGLAGIDRTVQVRRAIEWAIGEVLVTSSFGQDIVDGTEGKASFTFQLSASSADSEPYEECNPSSNKTRCQAANEAVLVLSRALRARLGANLPRPMTVALEYQDMTAGDVTTPALVNNRLVKITVEENPSGGAMTRLWPAVTVNRTEVIG